MFPLESWTLRSPHGTTYVDGTDVRLAYWHLYDGHVNSRCTVMPRFPVLLSHWAVAAGHSVSFAYVAIRPFKAVMVDLTHTLLISTLFLTGK